MKKLKLLFIIIILNIFSIEVNALEANELVKFKEYTIEKDTTISELIEEFGEPKIQTNSPFGGYAYSFYDDGYSYYLFIETNKEGVIKSYGGINGNFETNKYKYLGDSPNVYTYMGGEDISNYTLDHKVYGFIQYNTTSSEFSNSWNNYVNDNIYLYNLQKHFVEAARVTYKTINGTKIIPQTYVNEDIFYRIEQLKKNNSTLYDYARYSGKTSKISMIKGASSLNFYNYLPNPIIPAADTANYNKPDTYKYLYYNIHIKDATSKKYGMEIEFIDPTFLNKMKSIDLTNEEINKLNLATEEYNKYTEIGENLTTTYDEEPNYESLPLNAGKYNINALELATKYLNVARLGLGLNALILDEDIANAAQHKATLVYYTNNNGMTSGHFPEKPEGVSDEFYQLAQSYMNENLYHGTIVSSISNALNDGYGDPVACGHRYNLLNPYYERWGVGSVGTGIYGTQGVHKFSGMASNNTELVAWPSNGIFPIDVISGSIGNWTAKFYSNYQVTSNTEVTITKLNDGTTYEITKENTGTNGKFLKMSSNSLITFRDDNITYENGDVFSITLSNIKNSDGELINYTYRSVFHNFYQANYTSASDIELNTEELTLEVGESSLINAIVLPTDADIKWTEFSSKNNSIATIRQDGLVTAIKPGKTTITITSGDVTKNVSINVKDASGVVPEYLKGDMNNNNTIELSDVIISLRMTLGFDESTDLDKQIGDMNENGEFDLTDVILILRKSLGFE